MLKKFIPENCLSCSPPAVPPGLLWQETSSLTMIDSISQELTPMVATARKIKQEHPHAKLVFIGPCASKKLEASRTDVRSDVDFVITFEELVGMFEAKNIDIESFEGDSSFHDATGAGRGYAVAGGVASAVEACLKEYYPDIPVHIEHAEGLAECKKILTLAKAGKLKNCMIEGMGCPGGCMAGAGTNAPIQNGSCRIEKVCGFFQRTASSKRTGRNRTGLISSHRPQTNDYNF